MVRRSLETARERETWQEHGELGRLRRELDVPVTHVIVGDSGATAATGL
jgi:hypothetical protein